MLISIFHFHFLDVETVNIFNFMPILQLIKTWNNKAIVIKLMKRDPSVYCNEGKEININSHEKNYVNISNKYFAVPTLVIALWSISPKTIISFQMYCNLELASQRKRL